MAELTIDSKYIDVLAALGNPKETLEEAVRRYATERIAERIGKLQREILNMQATYQMPYEIFSACVTTDDKYVDGLRDSHPTWERDFQTWEYYIEELSEWLGRLENISSP